MNAGIVAVCVSPQVGAVKTPVPAVEITAIGLPNQDHRRGWAQRGQSCVSSSSPGWCRGRR